VARLGSKVEVVTDKGGLEISRGWMIAVGFISREPDPPHVVPLFEIRRLGIKVVLVPTDTRRQNGTA
jgi:hypothetical protein